MRQLHATKIGNPRTSRKEPLAERILKRRNFTDEEIGTIIQRRTELIQQMTDWKIATIIARELNRSPRSVETKIKELIKDGTLEENPNKKKKHPFNAEENRQIAEELTASGLCDGAIAKVIAEKTGRRVSSVKTSICADRNKKRLGKNPNNQRTMRSEESKWIMRRRRELMDLGLNDTSISRVLESKTRNASAIRRTIWELKKVGMIMENYNDMKESKEIERMILRREELMAEGKNDDEIAKQIAEEMKRQIRTISFMIWRIVRIGKCRINKN
ncbi:hypothetical protein KKB44_06275 [Candidatus Micrarchaeota archaeon]|nr:hypothetical protein [Candidatus Micrarchaeota archaeon]